MKGIYKDITEAMITMGLLIAVGFWFGFGLHLGIQVASSF